MMCGLSGGCGVVLSSCKLTTPLLLIIFGVLACFLCSPHRTVGCACAVCVVCVHMPLCCLCLVNVLYVCIWPLSPQK